jgi:hypothetical protein
MRRALETVPDTESVGLRNLYQRAWHIATSKTGRPSPSWRDNMIASLLSVLLALGLFLDGWNHINLQEGRLGPFLTPWHYGLYAGFTVTALWVLTRNQRRGHWSLAAIPRGYGAALVGMGLATIATAGDAVWHTEFGVEVGVTRVISPFHLFLFLAGFLLVSSAFRAAWHSNTPASVKRLRTFLPTILSLSIATALVAYFFQYASPLLTWTPQTVLRLANNSAFRETMQIYGVVSVLITNLILITPILLILRRWDPPYGTTTVLFTTVSLLSATMTNLNRGGLVAASFAGGLVADMAIARLRPSPQRPAATRATGAIIPAALWACQFATLRLAYHITWSPELWLGSIVLASLTGLGLTLLTVPPRLPEIAWAASPDEATATDATLLPFPHAAAQPQEDQAAEELQWHNLSNNRKID